MRFADYYFERFKSENRQVSEKPADDLFMICVIPSFNEPDIAATLNSLKKAICPNKSAEIIVVVNQPENSPEYVIKQNFETLEVIKKYQKQFTKKVKLHYLYYPALPRKHAGAGLARKKGMDEALHRFNELENPNGIITCTDADCLIKENYFTELENFFNKNPQAHGGSIHYEHRIFEPNMTEADNLRIINYELHLRYVNQALRYIGFPHAFQTIGSAFAVRADVYASVGGMNKRKAGEDFYFLQKVIESGRYFDINDTAVYPSGRSSDRVPFGTGAAIKKMYEQNVSEYYTYNLKSFFCIAKFIEAVDLFFTQTPENIILNDCVMQFLKNENFYEHIKNAKKISTDIKTFKKHFFQRFNAFRMVKYLNYAKINCFEAQPVSQEAIKLYNLLTRKKSEFKNFEILNLFRDLEKGNGMLN